VLLVVQNTHGACNSVGEEQIDSEAIAVFAQAVGTGVDTSVVAAGKGPVICRDTDGPPEVDQSKAPAEELIGFLWEVPLDSANRRSAGLVNVDLRDRLALSRGAVVDLGRVALASS